LFCVLSVALNAVQADYTKMVSGIWAVERGFSDGYAETAATGFLKNHHKKIKNGQ